VVAYAAEAFTKVPVTSDHQVVIDEIKNLNPQVLNREQPLEKDFPLQ
jgi:CMP-N-acetylneuraminic acid synthetase